MYLRCGPHTLDLTRPVVMGVLNVTPDSFSDGGRYLATDNAIAHGHAMADAGASIIDIGGESTRPGAADVSEVEEIDRVVPVIETLAARSGIVVSVDTSKAAVMRAAVAAGAGMINDVRALMETGSLAAAADGQAAVCLMHMQGTPRTMQAEPHYDDVVAEVRAFLDARVNACRTAGIAADRLVLDPGIGFGKRLAHNLSLLASLPTLGESGLPLLIGVSRKAMLGTLLGKDPEHRVYGGVAVAAAAVLGGASILRVHDVAETLDAVKVATALRDAGYRSR
jgi:dihydropteroate synthase